MQRVGHQDAQIVGTTRTARAEVSKEAKRLAALETPRPHADQPDPHPRNDVAAMQAALLTGSATSSPRVLATRPSCAT